MAKDTEEPGSMLATLVDFVKALKQRRKRARALREAGRWIGGFALACLAVVVVAAAAQIRNVGFASAWVRFGLWWVFWPLAAGLLPIAFMLGVAAIEATLWVAFFAVALVFNWLPSLVIGEERADRLFGYMGKLPVVGIVGLVLWAAWDSGTKSVTHAIATSASRAPQGTSPFALVGSIWHWVVTNPVPVTLSSLVLVPLISQIVKRCGENVADAMVKPQARRVRVLYGADGRVVREVVIED